MRVGLWEAGSGSSRGARAESGAAGSWQAELSLAFDVRGGRSVLARAEHRGPLRVQRPFYPERDQQTLAQAAARVDTCHVYLLHPPGGAASGDALHITAELRAGARVLATTPGAGKFYRARAPGAPETQLTQQLTLGQGACVEWFPQEAIIFDGAEARLTTHVELAPDAVFAGWEIVCLGRPSCGERFARGRLHTELSIRVGAQLRFMERGRYEGGGPVLHEAWGLHGAPVFGLFALAHPAASLDWLEPLREQVAPSAGLFGATLVGGVILGRYLGHSTLDARACFEGMYSVLRPLYAGRRAVTPRIWRT